MNCDNASATTPRAKTPAVCATVTVAPRASASAARPPRPDQRRGDHRLAVAGRERVQRAPAAGGQEEQDEHAAARGRVGEERGEPGVAAARARGRPARAGGDEGAVPGATRRRARSARRLEQRLRIARRPSVTSSAGTSARTAVPAPGRTTIERQPSRSPNVASSSTTSRGARTARAGRARRASSGARPAGTIAAAGSGGPQRHAPAVDGQGQPAQRRGALAREHLARRRPALAERGDLGLVEHPAHVDAVREAETTASWLMVKLPSGWASAAARTPRARRPRRARRRRAPGGGARPARGAPARVPAPAQPARRAPHHAPVPALAITPPPPAARGGPARPATGRATPARARRDAAAAAPGRSAGRQRGQPGVAHRARVAPAAGERPLRPAQALVRPAGAGQRPAERVGRAHARRLGPGAPGEAHGVARVAVVGREDGGLDVDVTPAPASRRRSVATSARSPRARGILAGGELHLGERGHVLGQREALDQAPRPRDRGGGRRGPRRGARGPPRRRRAGRAARRHRRRAARRRGGRAPAPDRRTASTNAVPSPAPRPRSRRRAGRAARRARRRAARAGRRRGPARPGRACGRAAAAACEWPRGGGPARRARRPSGPAARGGRAPPAPPARRRAARRRSRGARSVADCTSADGSPGASCSARWVAPRRAVVGGGVARRPRAAWRPAARAGRSRAAGGPRPRRGHLGQRSSRAPRDAADCSRRSCRRASAGTRRRRRRR